MQRTRHAISLLVTAALVAASCGSDGGEAVDDDVIATDQESPGAEPEPAPEPEPEPEPESDGGSEPAESIELADTAYTIDLDGDITVSVPAGERADVTAELVTSTDELIEIELGPSGSEFGQPIVVELPVPAIEEPSLVTVVATLVSDDGTERAIGLAEVEGGLAFSIDHFSRMRVTRKVSDSPIPVLVGAAEDFQTVTVDDLPNLSRLPASGIRGVAAVGDTFGVPVADVEVLRNPTGTLWGMNATSGSVELVDGEGGVFRCAEEGQGGLELSAVAGQSYARVSTGVICEAAAPPTLIAQALDPMADHDAANRTPEENAVGILTVIELQTISDLESFAFVGAIVDTSGDGLLTPTDRILFDPVPVVPGQTATPGINQFGDHFIFAADAFPAVPSGGFELTGLEQTGSGWTFVVGDEVVEIVVAVGETSGEPSRFTVGADPLITTTP